MGEREGAFHSCAWREMEQERKREAEEGEEKDIERRRDVLLPRPAI